MKGYCVKCRLKQPLLEVKTIVTSNQKKAKKGVCKICGTQIIVFV